MTIYRIRGIIYSLLCQSKLQYMAFLSWQPFFLFVSIFLAVFLSFFMKLKSKKRKFNLPPNPPKLPIIGNLHQLGNMPHLSLQCLAKSFGPIIYLQLGEVPTVVISSARLAKEVMKTHDLALSSRPKIFSAKHLLYNCTDVAFSPYGAYWRHIRKICILELLSAKRVESYSFVREEEVARLVSRVAESYPNTTIRKFRSQLIELTSFKPKLLIRLIINKYQYHVKIMHGVKVNKTRYDDPRKLMK